MAMSITIYCNDCEQFVSLDLQGNCKFCGSHSVGVVDRLQGVPLKEERENSRQKPFEMDQSER
jgi:Zn finger protein HypA/HybF involved in hydrogenase expression